MEIVLFTIVGIALYLFADWAVRIIERYRGARLEHRSVVFFVIILATAIPSFQLIQYLLQSGNG